MTDFYLGCNDGSFTTVKTLAGVVIRCSGTIANVSEAELIESLSTGTLSQWFDVIFGTPNQAELQTAFMAGCTIPLIAYLSAWAYGKLINFATRDDNNY
ncbi:MAG: hypothetical protein P1U47_13050 [Zhongshania sp.]|uniref:hypothetical protein n=1 Tax=Zhongshania sp. TaxID=1971902 RepID=UPI0026033B1B|nr:hypothetical protein [Zhongshania sp.]MDF1693290.1 hypothetical protein [Zhongshania sp.]MDF1693301.1 hypothetical protein [Zhongshania sp.]